MKAFQFKTLSDFEKFYTDYTFIVSNIDAHNANFGWSLDEILEAHLVQNPGLAFKMLVHILATENSTQFRPSLLLNGIVDRGNALAKSYFNLLQSHRFKIKNYWLLDFFQRLKPADVDEEYYASMLDNFRKIESVYNLDLTHLENYIPQNHRVFPDVLLILLNKYEANGTVFTFRFNFFEKHHHYFADTDLPLLKKTYHLQEQLDRHYDLDCKDWVTLAGRDSSFVVEYFREKLAANIFKDADEHHKLAIIWQLDNAEELVEQVIIETSTFDRFPITPFQHSANELFIGMPNGIQERAAIFLENMVEKHCGKVAIIQTLFNIVRRGFSDRYESAFLRFLAHNQDLDFFQKINWGEDAGRTVLSGRDTIWGEREAQRWEKVLDFLGKVPKPSSIIRHKAYVKEQMEHARSWAAQERRRLFQDDNF